MAIPELLYIKKDICHVFAKVLLFQTNLVTKKNNSIKRNTPL